MPQKVLDNTTVNAQAKLSAHDLSLLNGVSEKINSEFLKNLRDVMVYAAAEMVRDGAGSVSVDYPFVGSLTISRSTSKKGNTCPGDLYYSFTPAKTFDKNMRLAFDEGYSEIPSMLADKYGAKLLSTYQKFLEE